MKICVIPCVVGWSRVHSSQGKPGKPGEKTIFLKSEGKPGKVRELLENFKLCDTVVILLFRRWIIKVVYGQSFSLPENNSQSKIFCLTEISSSAIRTTFFAPWVTHLTFLATKKNILTLHDSFLYSCCYGNSLGRKRKAAGPAKTGRCCRTKVVAKWCAEWLCFLSWAR